MSTIPKSTTLVFLGRSGCGKDTQIEFLMKRPEFSGAALIEMGEVFRALSQKNFPISRRIKEILNVGGRQPWWLASHIWISKISFEIHGGRQTIISGTPRTVEEARLLDEVTEFTGREKSTAILLEVSREEARRRLLLRRRGDDTTERIENRLAYYEIDVLPAIEYYRKEKRLIEVNGEQSRKEVFTELEEKLKKYFGER